MDKIKLNLEYFEKPRSKFITNLKLKKIYFYNIDIYGKKPCIYISPKVSKIDYELITKCFTTKFVFLKEEIVTKINTDNFSPEEEKLLLAEINNLVNFGYSISLIWSNSPSIFGENQKLSENLISILHKTKLDIKFLTFPDLFFALPVWSNQLRNTKIFANQSITIKTKMTEGLSKKEIIKIFNNSIPSSATQYLIKYPINIRSNNTAVGLEKVLYACPNCKKLLSIYSEFSCIKCKECGSAIELGKNGEILFSKNISTFDDIEAYQFSCLKKHDFNINKIIEYNKITQIISENYKKPIKFNVILQIYAEKLVIKNPLTHKKTEYLYEDFESIDYTYDNNILIKIKNAKQLHFFGNSNENLLIIRDLVKINKN